MMARRTPPSALERRIARELGVTDAGLAVLLRIKRGDPVSGGTAGEKLEQQGFVTPYHEVTGSSGWYSGRRQLTEAGRALIERARTAGY